MITPTILIIAGLIILNIAQALYAWVLERKLWIAEVTERTTP